MEKEFLNEVLKCVVGDYCNRVVFSISEKYVYVYSNDKSIISELLFKTEEEIIFAVNQFLNCGFSVEMVDFELNKLKIVNDNVVPRCKED